MLWFKAYYTISRKGFKTEHVGGLVLIFLSRQNILLWSVYVKYCVFLYGLGVMNEADCVYVGDLKKKERLQDTEMKRFKE